jgi:hypothetical protein
MEVTISEESNARCNDGVFPLKKYGKISPGTNGEINSNNGKIKSDKTMPIPI